MNTELPKIAGAPAVLLLRLSATAQAAAPIVQIGLNQILP